MKRARTRSAKREDPERHAAAASPAVGAASPVVTALWQGLALALYVGIIVLVSTHHEMWRDEVRAWSVAIGGSSVSAMLSSLRDEGHPFLWYLLLRAAHAIARTPLVLPAASLAVAIVSAGLFLRRAPLPPVLRVLFLFGVLPVFQYSVMCRNYGLGMLLVFLISARYERRFQEPILHGTLLFLLASSSAHAAVLAGAFVVAWVWEAWTLRSLLDGARRRVGFATGMGLALLGIALCAYVTFPSAGSTVTGIRHATPAAVASGAIASVLRPARHFEELVSGGLPLTMIGLESQAGHALLEVLATFLLAIAVIRLWRHRDLLAALVAATVAFGWFFALVYAGYLRHVGLLLVMILGLDWIACRREDAGGAFDWQRRGLTWALAVVLVIHAIQGYHALQRDYDHTLSSSKGFAQLVRDEPRYRDAIIVVEPDFLLESLPYYLDQKLYSVEEEKFERWTHFTHTLHDTLSLGTLLDSAEALERRERVPVLLALGHLGVLTDEAGSIPYRFASRFTWTDSERHRLLDETNGIGAFLHSDGIENYAVFELHPSHKGAPPGAP